MPATAIGGRSRVRRGLDAIGYRPLLVLLGLGIAVRVATMALFFPAVMTSYDSPRFARVGPEGLFDDYWMPAGYPAFLKVLHHVSHQVWFSIAVQHVIGIVVAVLLFLAVRRLGTPNWLACVPAGVLLLAGDNLYLEHLFDADTFMFALCVAGLAAGVRGLYPEIDRRWLAVAGALLAGSALSRPPAIVALLVLLLCVAVWTAGGWRRRVTVTLATAAGAALIFGLYFASFEIKHGQYAGVSDMADWHIYARAAPFADCSKFTPPAGTRALCDSRPDAERPGPFGYYWPDDAVARRLFTPLGPASGKLPGEFGRAAIVHQPLDYLSAVAIDLARYVEPAVGRPRGYSGQSRELVSFGYRDPGVEQVVTSGLARRYSGTTLHAPGTDLLESYQDLVRVDRLELVLVLLLTFVGMVVARGPLRLGVFLFGLSGLGLYVVPVLVLSYDFRYGIPPAMLVVASGTLGAAALLARRG